MSLKQEIWVLERLPFISVLALVICQISMQKVLYYLLNSYLCKIMSGKEERNEQTSNNSCDESEETMLYQYYHNFCGLDRGKK